MENTKAKYILSLSGYEFKIIELLKRAIKDNKINAELEDGNDIKVSVRKAIDSDLNLNSVTIKFNKTGKEQLRFFPLGQIAYLSDSLELLQCNSNSVYFTISGKMDGKVSLNRHIVFDIKVNEYNLTLDANIVLSEYADRKMEFIKLFNKINSIRMLDSTAFDDTEFEFTNTYARIKLRDSELPKFNIVNSYKYYLDKLNSTLYCYCESLKDEIKGEN